MQGTQCSGQDSPVDNRHPLMNQNVLSDKGLERQPLQVEAGMIADRMARLDSSIADLIALYVEGDCPREEGKTTSAHYQSIGHVSQDFPAHMYQLIAVMEEKIMHLNARFRGEA